MLRHANATGQALTESILLLPVFLLFVIGVLQISQIGVAIVLSQYAASSVARKASSAQVLSSGSHPDLNTYEPKVKALMQVGMQYDGMQGCVANTNSGNDPTAELEVAVRSKIEAWPFFSTLMNQVVQTQYSTNVIDCTTMSNPGGIGPVNFSGQSTPPYFYITGKAKVRLNYVP